MRIVFAQISALVAGVLLAASTANAGFIGSTVRVETQFPTIGSVCCGSADVVVGAGVELPPGSFPSYNSQAFVDLSDTQIEYGQTGGTTYVVAAFNGFRFFDVLGEIDAIVNVTINPSTNLAGFDSSRVTFDANNVFINMQGLSASAAHHVVLDVSFAAVPEPMTLALLGFGLAGLALRRRREIAR